MLLMDTRIYTIASAIVIVANIIFILTTIFFERKKPIQALAWVLTLAMLPALGFILYLVFGRNLRIKKKKSLLIKKEKDREYSTAVFKTLTNVTYNEEEAKEYTLEEIKQIIKFNINLSASPLTKDNKVTVYTDAKYKYEDLLKDIKEATSSIHMLYFIINNDDIGKKIINALAEKAKQGVTVRVLYDHGGSLFTPYKAFNPILENGGEVKRFFPISFGSYLRVNFRNHRKIVVIDGKIGYVGGINIGDEYLGMKKKLSPWRDTHLKITGSSVYCLQMRFMEDWYYACRDDFRYDDIMKYFAPINEHDKGNTGIQVVSSGPDTNGEEIKRGMIKIINSAKKRILIQTPYFIPDEPFLEALQNAALAGIEVIVQIPSIPDKRFVYKVTTSYIADLLKFNIKVYQFPGFLHAKMMIVDNSMCTIGTSNIDMRSFALNFEVNAFLYGEEFASKCTKIFYKDLDICTQVTEDEYSSRSLFSKIEESIYRLMSPLL